MGEKLVRVMQQQEGRIAIPGAGMHPYVWGKVRFSVWILIVVWFLTAGGLELWLQPFPVVPGLIGVFIVGTVIYLAGVLQVYHHPFFPEVMTVAAWRAMRRAFYLHS